MRIALALLICGSCGGGGSGALPDGRELGETHAGQYNLGPVEWTGSFNNACSPYPAQIETLEGDLLAGLDNSVAAGGDWCDACVEVTTAMGKTAVLRVVTYGVSNAPGDMDVSQAAFDLLSAGEYPRTMTWRMVECPTTDPLYFQFQTGANPSWTSLWVRNPREKIDRVEVEDAAHADWFALTRAGDGTLTDAGGFGTGAFTLRVTGADGAQVEEPMTGFTPGALVAGHANLP